jgi:hypothetical protein
MIYAQEGSPKRQIALLELASQLSGGSVLVAWLYPVTNATLFMGIPVSNNSRGLMPVTTYDGGAEQGPSTRPVDFTPAICAELIQRRSKLLRRCDSIAIYHPGENDWFACAIHHENICLIKDKALLPQLAAKGFCVSEQAPSWW